MRQLNYPLKEQKKQNRQVFIQRNVLVFQIKKKRLVEQIKWKKRMPACLGGSDEDFLQMSSYRNLQAQ